MIAIERKALLVSAWILIIAWAFFAVGLYFGLGGTPEMFERFGSLVVLFAVMSEYVLKKTELDLLYKGIKGKGSPECTNPIIQDLSPSKMYNALTYASHLTVVTGTLIWGFGTMFFKWALG